MAEKHHVGLAKIALIKYNLESCRHEGLAKHSLVRTPVRVLRVFNYSAIDNVLPTLEIRRIVRRTVALVDGDERMGAVGPQENSQLLPCLCEAES